MENQIDVHALRAYSGHRVRVSLDHGGEYTGMLRTELLTDLSVSVYLDEGNGDGVTLYIEQIASVGPAS